ncbi:HAD-IA family hydrolase [Hoyosella sp. YIM 151337]|uniref:HAD-IA family hydrolase n=1 Tax=Hoyosella sp. YIM 151337 TaxID=2992742 RepID=UPI0035A966E7
MPTGTGRTVNGCSTVRFRSAKPDHSNYLEVAAHLGVAPAHCIVVDDSTVNVAAADALGMRTHQYISPAALRTFLAA